MNVAFTHYPRGGEKTIWCEMPQIPMIGDTVHLDRAYHVTHVSWVRDDPTAEDSPWHAELAVR
jgi:hypothetical protein